jgi:hypothetical protein
MNLLMCFIVLFVLAFILIKVVSDKDKQTALQPKGKVIIHLHWDDKSDTDLDLWVRTDNPRRIVSFREKDVSNMWLDHDSQGIKSNQVIMSDGSIKETFGNDEIVQMKECTNTRVDVNVQTYKLSNDITEYPLSATVEVIMPPSYDKIITKTFTMSGVKGEEKTAFSFDLDEDCKISNVDNAICIWGANSTNYWIICRFTINSWSLRRIY